MTIEEVKAKKAQLEAAITQLLQAFESETGCIVHSVPLIPATQEAPIQGRVKVQIGQ